MIGDGVVVLGQEEEVETLEETVAIAQEEEVHTEEGGEQQEEPREVGNETQTQVANEIAKDAERQLYRQMLSCLLTLRHQIHVTWRERMNRRPGPSVKVRLSLAGSLWLSLG